MQTLKVNSPQENSYKNVPCTVIEVGPCVVTQVKTVEKDGYEALQLGFIEKKDKHTTKPMKGHFDKAGVAPQRHLAEFSGFEGEHALGETISVELFDEGSFVDVVGTSKGKGYQGVVRKEGVRFMNVISNLDTPPPYQIKRFQAIDSSQSLINEFFETPFAAAIASSAAIALCVMRQVIV